MEAARHERRRFWRRVWMNFARGWKEKQSEATMATM
jgi:hypothetical protein